MSCFVVGFSLAWGGGVTVVCCLHTCQFSFQQCRVWQYLLLSPACQLRGGRGMGACRLRVTSPRKCRLEHRISQKGKYRCSCSEQFRAIAVQLLSKCQPSSTGTENPSSPQAVARAWDVRAGVGVRWESSSQQRFQRKGHGSVSFCGNVIPGQSGHSCKVT